MTLYILEYYIMIEFKCGCKDCESETSTLVLTKEELISKIKKERLHIHKVKGLYEDVAPGCGCCDMCPYQVHCQYDGELDTQYVKYVYGYKEEVGADYCDSCAPFYTNEDEYWDGEVDYLFHSEILSHGLATPFSGRKITNEEIIERATNIAKNTNWQICCCDKNNPIGPIGLYVSGWVHYASNVDLWSYLNKRGDRVFDIDKAGHLIYTKDQLDLTVWDHTEFIVSNVKIKAVWLKISAVLNNDELINVAQKLSDTLKLKIFYVHDRASRFVD